MPKPKHGLGRGLDALLADAEEEHAEESAWSGEQRADGTAGGAVVMVKPDLLKPNPRQPRKEFDEEALNDLAASIRERGIIQPIIAEKADSGGYYIIAGERRARAARIAGLAEVPVIVREVPDKSRLVLALIENIQRENLNPLEEAQAYAELMRLEGLSQEEAAARVGKSRPAVANALRLLKLPEDMRQSLASGGITAGHARALLSVANPADRRALFERIESEGLSVRECEALSAQLNSRGNVNPPNGSKKKKKAASTDPDIVAIEERLIEAFGTKVSVKGGAEKGVIEISYFSADDFNRVYELLTRGQGSR